MKAGDIKALRARAEARVSEGKYASVTDYCKALLWSAGDKRIPEEWRPLAAKILTEEFRREKADPKHWYRKLKAQHEQNPQMPIYLVRAYKEAEARFEGKPLHKVMNAIRDPWE